MPSLAELKNEWAEAVTKAKGLAAGGDLDAFDRAWADAEGARKRYENLSKLEAAEAAIDSFHKPAPALADFRSPDDAAKNITRLVTPDEANLNPSGFKDLGNGRIVPFATKATEGYIRSYPASVQLPEIRARYGADLMREASEEREAFALYVRKGFNSTRWNDDGGRLKRALDRLGARNALQENTDSEGGYLVPSDDRSELIHDAGYPGGVTRQISRVMTTSRDAGTIPSGTTITWGSIAEEATPSDSDPAFGQVAFTIRKTGFNDTVSEELLADSAFDVVGFLQQVGMEERGRYEDQQAIEGDGANEPLGLRTTGAAQGDISDITDLLTLAAPTLLEVVSAVMELPAQFRNGGTRLHTTSSLVARIMSISATGGQTFLMPDAQNAPGFRLMGYPIVMYDGTGWDNANTIAANEEVGALGDFARYYVFMDRLGTVFRRDDSVAFRSDQVAFKMRARYDSFFTENNAFRIWKGAGS